MVTQTFYAPSNLSRRIQLLVGQCDAWFSGNPQNMFNDRSWFSISFDAGSDYQKFNACIVIIQQPYF